MACQPQFACQITNQYLSCSETACKHTSERLLSHWTLLQSLLFCLSVHDLQLQQFVYFPVDFGSLPATVSQRNQYVLPASCDSSRPFDIILMIKPKPIHLKGHCNQIHISQLVAISCNILLSKWQENILIRFLERKQLLTGCLVTISDGQLEKGTLGEG